MLYIKASLKGASLCTRPPKIPIKVAVVYPVFGDSAYYTFKICQDTECVSDLSVSSFGDRDNPGLNLNSKISKETHNLLYRDITDQRRWQFEKVRAKITSSKYEDFIPQSLVVINHFDEKTHTVTLGPEQKKEEYGDLLGEFTVEYEK